MNRKHKQSKANCVHIVWDILHVDLNTVRWRYNAVNFQPSPSPSPSTGLFAQQRTPNVSITSPLFPFPQRSLVMRKTSVPAREPYSLIHAATYTQTALTWPLFYGCSNVCIVSPGTWWDCNNSVNTLKLERNGGRCLETMFWNAFICMKLVVIRFKFHRYLFSNDICFSH